MIFIINHSFIHWCLADEYLYNAMNLGSTPFYHRSYPAFRTGRCKPAKIHSF